MEQYESQQYRGCTINIGFDGFVNNLNKKYPDGFDIKWDEPSIGSPYFDPKPEFGLACDCVTLRIYKK